MTREELKEHCEKQIENCEMWAKYKREEPSGKIYEEHKLILKLLEQESNLDKIRKEIKVMTSNRGFLSCSVEYIHKEIDNVFDKYEVEIDPQESEE